MMTARLKAVLDIIQFPLSAPGRKDTKKLVMAKTSKNPNTDDEELQMQCFRKTKTEQG